MEKSQASTFKLPRGWDSRETIAEQLDCSPESVRRLMSAAVKSGTVECQQFPVYDMITKKIVRVTAYRQVQKTPPTRH